MGATRAARPAPERGAATHGVAERRLSACKQSCPFLSDVCARSAASLSRRPAPTLETAAACCVLPMRGPPATVAQRASPRAASRWSSSRTCARRRARTSGRCARANTGAAGWQWVTRVRAEVTSEMQSPWHIWANVVVCVFLLCFVFCVCVFRLCECGFPWAAQAAEVCSALVVSMP